MSFSSGIRSSALYVISTRWRSSLVGIQCISPQPKFSVALRISIPVGEGHHPSLQPRPRSNEGGKARLGHIGDWWGVEGRLMLWRVQVRSFDLELRSRCSGEVGISWRLNGTIFAASSLSTDLLNPNNAIPNKKGRSFSDSG